MVFLACAVRVLELKLRPCAVTNFSAASFFLKKLLSGKGQFFASHMDRGVLEPDFRITEVNWTHRVSLCCYFFLSKSLKPCWLWFVYQTECCSNRVQYSFQFQLDGSGCGLRRQQLQCILVFVGLLPLRHKILFLSFFSRHSSFQQ